MLPHKWKLVVRNNTGGPCTIDKIAVTPWNFDSNGAVQYGSEIDLALADPGNGNHVASAEQDNSTGKYFGFKGLVKGDGGGTSGALEVYIEWPDASGQYPSSQGGNENVPQDCIQLAALSVANGGRATNFSYE